MTTDNMVERVARAIFDAGERVYPWDKTPEEAKDTFRKYASAAIAASINSTDGPNDNALREALDDCAKLPCQTKGNEDAESGCCATCRARAALNLSSDPVGGE